jgi:hypothetical protein
MHTVFSVAIMPKLPPESSRYCVSVPGRDKSFISSPYRLWSTPILVLNGAACPVPVVKQPSSRVEVKNGGVILIFPYAPLWRGQGQLYICLTHVLCNLVPYKYFLFFVSISIVVPHVVILFSKQFFLRTCL